MVCWQIACFKPAISLATHKPSFPQSLDFAHVPHKETVTWMTKLALQQQTLQLKHGSIIPSVLICGVLWSAGKIRPWVLEGFFFSWRLQSFSAVSKCITFMFEINLSSRQICSTSMDISLATCSRWLHYRSRKIPPELVQAWSREDDQSSSILDTSHVRCLPELLWAHGTLQSPSAQNEASPMLRQSSVFCKHSSCFFGVSSTLLSSNHRRKTVLPLEAAGKRTSKHFRQELQRMRNVKKLKT